MHWRNERGQLDPPPIVGEGGTAQAVTGEGAADRQYYCTAKMLRIPLIRQNFRRCRQFCHLPPQRGEGPPLRGGWALGERPYGLYAKCTILYCRSCVCSG